MKNNTLKTGIICFISALLGAGCLFGGMYFFPTSFGKVITETVEKTVETRNVTVNDTGIAEAVDKIYDAVVVVKNYQKQELYSTGTGFVYEIDGNIAYILTNHHVIEGGNDIYVQFTDGTSVQSKLVGSDKYADIAVLSMEANDSVKIASIGSSENIRVGDTVFAVGAPLDASTYSGTVTRGIISGKNRMVSVSLSNKNVSDWVMSVLQTDAAINSGNSGGPLANANGEVIGITSLKLVNSGVEGMGFAIPIETAMEYAHKIMNGEKIERPYLGVKMLNMSDARQAYYPRLENLGVTNGVFISEVEKNSPSEKGGLKAADVIVKVDGEEVSTIAYLKYRLYQHEIGDEVTLTVYRDGSELDVKLKLTEASTD